MYKKELIDIMSDLNTGIVNVGAVYVDSLTVIDYANILTVNPLSTKIKFPSDKIAPDTFGRTVISNKDGLTFYKILYQGTSDTIYAKDDKGGNLSITDFIKIFNQVTEHYKMDQACAYSQLHYKDEKGNDKVIEFPVSTLFLIELINTEAGITNRIYYKNSYDIGFIETTDYEIKDL